MSTGKSSDKGAALSDASIQCLQDVKKGQARKFVMICKGPRIVSLVLFKKGSFAKYINEAKQAGSGQVYFGVVDGQGENLSFKLARADGFTEAPVKSTVLKSFLQDEGDFKCKPLFEIVDVAPLVLDPSSNPLVAEFQALQPAAQAAASNHADQADAINTLCRQTGSLLDNDQNDAARAKLDELKTLLARLSGNVASPPVSASQAKWDQKLAEVGPRYDMALRTNHADVGKLRSVMAFATEKAAAGDFEKGVAALNKLQPLIDAVLAATTTAPASAPAEADLAAAEAKPPARPFSIVNAQAARLAWDKTRRQILAELQNLDRSIRAAVSEHNADADAPDEYVDTELDAGVNDLYGILEALDERLIGVLDQALNAEGELRDKLHEQARDLIDEYRTFVATSPLMSKIDKNPFLACSIKSRADKALTVLTKTL